MSEKKILIIDDDAVTTAVLNEYLTNSGYNVHNAINGNAGLKKMKILDPDLILLDIMMPGKDGIQILKEIKLTPGFASIPILLLTAVDSSEFKVKGLELGADDYITKPVDKAELSARIKVSIKRSEKNRRNGNILEGDLSNFSLSDLLQSIELGKKTATINLPDIEGKFVIKNGLIIRSEQSDFSGKKATNRIFLLEKGQFIVEFNKVDKGATDTPVKIINVLLENISYVDEIKNMAKSLPELSKEIKISKFLLELTGIKGIDDLSAITLRDLITRMEGSLKDNVESLIQINKDFPQVLNG